MFKRIVVLTVALFFITTSTFLASEKSPKKRDSNIHFDSILVDGHEDTLSKVVDDNTWLPETDIGEDTSFDMDIPKAQTGGLDAPFLAAYTQGFYKNKPRSISRTLALLNALYWTREKNQDNFNIATSVQEMEEEVESGKIAAVPTIEGAYSLEEENAMELLHQYDDLGVSVIGLTWSYSNDLGEGVNREYKGPDEAPSEGGLTELGEEVMEEMTKLGMVVDVSHMSRNTFWDVIEATDVPIIATHSSSDALTEHERNLTDEQLKALAENGGVVGINFYTEFIGENGKAYMEDVADHIDHVVDLIGIDHVGLGSDFDGATMPRGLEDASKLPELTDELIDRGYSDADIEKILGKNKIRVLKEVQSAATADQQDVNTGISITPNYEMGETVQNNTPLLTADITKDKDTEINQDSLRVMVDGIAYTPDFNAEESTLSLELEEPLSERFHVVTFEAKNEAGEMERETRIFYVRASAENMTKLVQQLESEDSFNNNQVAHDLKRHLDAIDHFEKQNKKDKVIKHTEGLKDLLEQQNNNDWMTEEAYVTLKDNANNLIDKNK